MGGRTRIGRFATDAAEPGPYNGPGESKTGRIARFRHRQGCAFDLVTLQACMNKLRRQLVS